MKTRVKLCASMLTMISTLACAFVQNMIFPPTQSLTNTPPPTLPPTISSTFSPTLLPTPFENPEPITCTDDNCLQACLDRLEEVLQTRPFDSIGNSIYEEQDAEFNLVIYQVNGDTITDPVVLYVPSEYRKYQEDTASHLRVWEFYVALIPAELRTFVKEFVIYTDGSEGGSSAWVSPSEAEEGFWQVGIDLLDSEYPPYLADALVHETAHLLTLNTSQIPSDENYYYYNGIEKKFMQCEQFANGGCSLPDSYINVFYENFWKDSYHEWWEFEQEAQNTKTDDEYFQVLERFYEQHSDWFVNSYAATNVEEDMAESFSYFVMNPKTSGNSIYEQKVDFYYAFPELVEYRQQIIEGLCSYVR
jgi:hypothetical protein